MTSERERPDRPPMGADPWAVSLSYREDVLESRRPRSLTSAIYDRLRENILTCRLKPGDKLLLVPLARSFDVSLAAVREALSRLAAERLVVAVDQRGFRVSLVSESDLEDLTLTRIEIEGLALRKSMLFGGEPWRDDVRRAWAGLAHVPYMDAADPTRHNEGWNALHDRFHRSLTRACGSVRLLRFRDVLHQESDRYRRLARPAGLLSRDPHEEHEGIVRAILDGDADTAVSRLGRHFSITKDLVLAAGKIGNAWASGTGPSRSDRSSTPIPAPLEEGSPG